MRFDDQGRLIVGEDHDSISYHTARDVRMVAEYMKAGKPYWHAPTGGVISREEAAFILRREMVIAERRPSRRAH